MKMTKQHIKGLKDELKYCKELVARGHKNPHWAIRIEEITKQLTKVDKMSKAKLGSGTRFANLKKELAAKGAKNPAAVAATIGREKYGNKKMASLSKAGKKK